MQLTDLKAKFDILFITIMPTTESILAKSILKVIRNLKFV